MNATPQLTDYVPAFDGPESYAASRPRVCPESRLRFLWRNRRSELVKAGAAILVGGRIYVHPERMDAILLEIFRADALLRAEPDGGPSAAGRPGALPPGAQTR